MNSNDWNEYLLEDVIQINPQYSIKKGTMAKKVAMANIEPFTRQIQGYEINEFKSGSKFINGDTLMARITPCLENGKTAFVDILNQGEVGFGSTEFFVLRGKEGKTINKFVYYLAISPDFRNIAIKSMTGTSGRQRAQKDLIAKTKIKIPDLHEQRMISDILSSLDEKIEVNQKIILGLEEISQALYKRWFADFEFPNANGEAYKSNGGSFIESEVGSLPKGWKTESLYNLGDFINGTSFNNDDYSHEGIPIIKIAELKNGVSSQTKFYQKDEKDKKFVINDKDILFSWSGNPETSIDTFIWYRGAGILNQHIFKIVPINSINKAFIYILFKSLKPLFTRIASNKQTTGLGHVTVADLKRIKIPLPPDAVLREFQQITGPLFEKIFITLREIENLYAIRNSLLPKLINGEIKVP